MDYLRYYEKDGFWHPPSDANLSEHLHKVISAGRGVRFDLKTLMPESYNIYLALEIAYQERTGRNTHTCHKLTDEQYKTVLAELEEVIKNDPCNREWMKY